VVAAHPLSILINIDQKLGLEKVEVGLVLLEKFLPSRTANIEVPTVPAVAAKVAILHS
jgi:hypothetical protein